MRRIETGLSSIFSIPLRVLESLAPRPAAYARVSQLLAGGIGATIGLAVSLFILINIAVLQSLKLIGGTVWPVEQAALFVVLAAIIGLLWGVGLLRLRPGLLRAVLGALSAGALATVVMMLLRWLFGYEPWSAGALFLFGGFALSFGAIWGMGGFYPSNMTVAAAHAAAHQPHSTPKPLMGAFDAVKFNVGLLKFIGNRIVPIVRPLVGPMFLALGIAMIGVFVVMIIGSFGPARVQTDRVSASAVTARGYLEGVELFGQPVSKLGFFIFISLLILGGIGSLALGLALIVNALSTQVQIAKKLPAEPLDLTEKSGKTGPIAHVAQFVVRLVRFFVDFILDIVNWLLRLLAIDKQRV